MNENPYEPPKVVEPVEGGTNIRNISVSGFFGITVACIGILFVVFVLRVYQPWRMFVLITVAIVVGAIAGIKSFKTKNGR